MTVLVGVQTWAGVGPGSAEPADHGSNAGKSRGQGAGRSLPSELRVRDEAVVEQSSDGSVPDGSEQNRCSSSSSTGASPSLRRNSKVGPSTPTSSLASRSLMFIPTDFSALSGK